MRKFVILASMIYLAVAANAKIVKTVNPVVDKTNTSSLFIDAVELSPDSATVTFHTYNFMNSRINIQPGATLVHNGKSHAMRHVSGIELGKAIEMPALGDSVFTISFEPLPMDTKVFDFIEGNGESSFRLEGIHTDKSLDDGTPLDELDILPRQKWEKGTAVVKGRILNYQPSDEPDIVQVYPRVALGRKIDENIGTSKINPDGTFEVEIPLYQSYQPCFFSTPSYYGLIYLSPGKESSVTIDAALRNRNTGKDGSVVFTGANDEINNQLALNIGKNMVWDSFNNNNYAAGGRKYTSAAEYKPDVLRHASYRKEKIRKLPFTPMMKQLMNVTITNEAAVALSDVSVTMRFDDIDVSYFDFYRTLDVANPVMMWAPDFDSFVNNARIQSPEKLQLEFTNIPVKCYTYLIENDLVAGEDAELARALIKNNIDGLPKDVVDEYARVTASRVRHFCDSLDLQGSEKVSAERFIKRLNGGEFDNFNDVRSYLLSWIIGLAERGHEMPVDAAMIPFEDATLNAVQSYHEENDSIITAFWEKYADAFSEWNFENEIDKSIDIFSRLYGQESTMMNRLFASRAYIDHIERRNTLSDGAIANCRRRLPDLFFDYVMEQNDVMAKTLVRANSNILDMNPENSGEQVLKDIAGKFKGKVIYIDIWATWCGPCLYAISELQPEKKNYADDVVFVYLADESSPQDAWTEKIESIEGEHFRLSNSQMQEIMGRYAFSGYPSYIVIGKDGSVAYTGFLHGLDNIKQVLDEAIAK